MSGKVSIFYTIAKYDPRTVEDKDAKVADIGAYLGLMSRLQADSRQKLKNILLGMARQLNQHRACKAEGNSEAYASIKNLFVDGSFDIIAEAGNCYLIERVQHGDEVAVAPLDVWTIDTRIFKAMLTKNLYSSGMDEDDKFRIELKYRLVKYTSVVRVGGFDDTETMDYVRKYNAYLIEFYKRSESPMRKVLVQYLRKAKRINELVCYGNRLLTNRFEFEVSAVGTLKQTKSRITEFAEDMAFYAERMYQGAYGEDALKSTTGKGKSHYKVKFEVYDNCLQVYDRYKDIVSANESIEDEKFNLRIDVKEGTRKLSDQKQRDRRKYVRRHYKMALDLIKQSTEGYLS